MKAQPPERTNRNGATPRFLDLRRLHQFVTAVEAPNLRIAAAQLFMTQQGLSASLRQLESDLGVDLFSRSGRTLLTNQAGLELYRRAPALLAGGRQTVEAVHRAIGETARPFVIGHTPAVSGEEVYRLIEPLLSKMPSQPFKVTQVYPDRIRDELHSGAIDVALRRAIDHSLDLESTVVAYHTLRLAVSVRHPLAQRKVVVTTDLVDYPIVVWGPEHQSFYTDFVVALCHREGFEPTLLVNPVQGTPPSTAVAADDSACAFVTDPAGEAFGGRVRVIEFQDAPKVPLQAVWLPHSASPVRDVLFGN
ncbi:LysR family transcriptional regulator [Gordonia sp. NPDC003376]